MEGDPLTRLQAEPESESSRRPGWETPLPSLNPALNPAAAGGGTSAWSLDGDGQRSGARPAVKLAPADPANTDTESSIAPESRGEGIRFADGWEFSPEEVAAALRAQAEVERDGSAPLIAAEAPQTFEQLFREYERYVASIGNRILGSNNGVEDLVQEVFLVIYQEFHKLRDIGSLKGWLATITTRLAWRQLGRPWLYTKLSITQVEELTPLESPDASPETRADLSVLIHRLRALPPSLRKPWVLRFIDGETLPRIAELCECSQSTVQRRLREAGDVMLAPAPVPVPSER
jgi:RNA polymerase sigma-70 factor, ECF subfamily